MAYGFVVVVVLLVFIILRQEKFRMSTNQGLTALTADIAALKASNAQLVSDVQKLLAGQQAGPGPGQVIVNQADIDALDATVQGMTAADTAADQQVNPPAAPTA